MTTLGATLSTATIGTAAAAATGDFAAAGSGGQYLASWYIGPRTTGVAAAAADLNVPSYVQVPIPKTCTVDRIGCEVTVVAASSVVRLGIYATNANGMPGTLVIDAGTVDGAVGTGFKEITISQALTAGVYYLCAVAQGGTPTMRRIQGALGQLMPAYNTGYLTIYPSVKGPATVAAALPGTAAAVAWTDNSLLTVVRYV